MKSDKTRELVILSLYAALIIVSVQFIRIPFGPYFKGRPSDSVDERTLSITSRAKSQTFSKSRL